MLTGRAARLTGPRSEKHSTCPRCIGTSTFGAALDRALRSAALEYDDVIVDIGAGDSDEMSAALEVADCAITPVRPSGIDVWTMGLMDARMLDAQLENENLRCWAIINCASTHPASSGRPAMRVKPCPAPRF